MVSPLLKIFTSVTAFFGPSEQHTSIEPKTVVDLFWAVHVAMPDVDRVEKLLRERAFLGEVTSDGNSSKSLQMYLADRSITVLADRTDFGVLGTEVGYTVTFSDATFDSAKKVQDLVTLRLGGLTPGPLPEQYQSEGWDSVAWPGEDGGAQLIYAVGHSQVEKLTNIWGSQLHIEEE